jgi:maltose alpha-D-glucosyltransferase/alpha-amylase
MLGNDRRRMELAFSLLFSLPGTPMIQYGDEIGLGENLALNEREATRTPMQWTSERHGGFSTAARTILPVVEDAIFGYQRVNVNAQRRDPDSFMNWCTRLLRLRRECTEIAWGQCRILDTSVPEVLALDYEFRGTSMITLHNFSGSAKNVRLRLRDPGARHLVDMIGDQNSRATNQGLHDIALEGYGYRWFRVGSADNTLRRARF